MAESRVRSSSNSNQSSVDVTNTQETQLLSRPPSQSPGAEPQIVSLQDFNEYRSLSLDASGTAENTNIKVVVIGDSLIGKTNLVYNLLGKDFDDNAECTEFNNYWYTAASGESPPETFKLHIWDLGGQMNDSAAQTRRLCYEDGIHNDVFIVCFSVINRESFENVRRVWRKEILQYWDKAASVILVGLQSEMRKHKYSDGAIPAGIVSYDEAKLLAKKLSFSKYIECSAKMSWNVKRVFTEVVRLASLNFKLEKALESAANQMPSRIDSYWKGRAKVFWRSLCEIFDKKGENKKIYLLHFI